MLAMIMTYQRILPEFLDFVFPFGRQEHPRDFHFGGFRYQTRLSKLEIGPCVPALGWSGCDYRLCYNLKSVEPSRGGGEPWSIRQAAIHHSFDLKSGQASWFIVKANRLLQNRVKSATGARGLPRVNSFQTLDRAFASTLSTHVLVCEWSSENWRWYADFLEEKFQQTTRRALSPIIRSPTSPTGDFDRSVSAIENQRQKGLGIAVKSTEKQSPSPPLAPPPPAEPIVPGFQPLATSIRAPPQVPVSALEELEKQQEFSFTDLQRIQNIEEKANSATLILKTNISVLVDLKTYYRTTAAFDDWPNDLPSKCEGDVLRFEQRLASIEKDMQMQQSRLKTLLRLIADRKSLVSPARPFSCFIETDRNKLHGILQMQRTKANQASTENMQSMTEEMHQIALKTKKETISMRIITFVTLCFLPGTFISVGLLMVCCQMAHEDAADV